MANVSQLKRISPREREKEKENTISENIENVENVEKQFPALSEEEIRRWLMYYREKRRITDALYISKAKKVGITVSEEEVEKVLRQKGYTYECERERMREREGREISPFILHTSSCACAHARIPTFLWVLPHVRNICPCTCTSTYALTSAYLHTYFCTCPCDFTHLRTCSYTCTYICTYICAPMHLRPYALTHKYIHSSKLKLFNFLERELFCIYVLYIFILYTYRE